MFSCPLPPFASFHSLITQRHGCCRGWQRWNTVILLGLQEHQSHHRTHLVISTSKLHFPPFKGDTKRQLLSTLWSVILFESGSSVGSHSDMSGPRNLSDSARLEVQCAYESEHPRWGEEIRGVTATQCGSRGPGAGAGGCFQPVLMRNGYFWPTQCKVSAGKGLNSWDVPESLCILKRRLFRQTGLGHLLSTPPFLSERGGGVILSKKGKSVARKA